MICHVLYDGSAMMLDGNLCCACTRSEQQSEVTPCRYTKVTLIMSVRVSVCTSGR